MIAASDFLVIVDRLRALPPLNGSSVEAHIDWSEKAEPPESPEQFAIEAIYVVCNSGMRHTVARPIFERIEAAILRGEPASTSTRAQLGLEPIFGHHNKTRAIDKIWAERKAFFDGFMAAPNKVEFCRSMPHFGPVISFHLAKNFGADVAKPDVHLERLAKVHGTDPQNLCAELGREVHLKARTVDLVLWMACARGVMDSATGEFRHG